MSNQASAALFLPEFCGHGDSQSRQRTALYDLYRGTGVNVRITDG